jgi:hypothetical protein
MNKSDLVEMWLRRLPPARQALWRRVFASLDVREFDRRGERIIQITHLPTGCQVEQVRGPDWAEDYEAALEELLDYLEDEGV